MQNFRNLKIWHESHNLTINIFKISQEFPRTLQFTLTSQLTRAAMSIEANISEGCNRGSNKEFKRFLQIALGSASEVDCFIELAHDLELIDHIIYNNLHNDITKIMKMISNLMKLVGKTN